MKIVFLDVDGVLNCPTTKDRIPKSGFIGLDIDKVALLNTLITDDVKIVLSSTWRRDRQAFAYLRNVLKINFGLDIYSSTEFLAGPRGEEIQQWIIDYESASEHKLDSFVILDDDSDMGDLTDRLVQTSWKLGLTAENVEAARYLLFEECNCEYQEICAQCNRKLTVESAYSKGNEIPICHDCLIDNCINTACKDCKYKIGVPCKFLFVHSQHE